VPGVRIQGDAGVIAAKVKGVPPTLGAIGRGRVRCDVVTPTGSTRGSNGAEYLARRLLRDAPETFAAFVVSRWWRGW
jgi:hypothetical protein